MHERFDARRVDWLPVLARLGVSNNFLERPHTSKPCPMHPQNGKTKFRFFKPAESGRWVCNDCGAGDGIDLLQRINGWSFVEAKSAINGTPIEQRARVQTEPSAADLARAKKERDRRFEQMRKWWRDAVPVNAGNAAGRYLGNRIPKVQIEALGTDLRCAKGLAFFVEGVQHDTYQKVATYPALIALFRDVAGEVKMMHRIFLTSDGRKAPVEAPKKMYMPEWKNGCAVRIGDVAARRSVIGVTEGIETAIAVFTGCHGRFPIWAAGSEHNVRHLDVPDDVQTVHIFADHNVSTIAHPKGVGLEAAEVLAEKLRKKGKTVVIHLAKKAGTDHLDEWVELVASREMQAA